MALPTNGVGDSAVMISGTMTAVSSLGITMLWGTTDSRECEVAKVVVQALARHENLQRWSQGSETC